VFGIASETLGVGWAFDEASDLGDSAYSWDRGIDDCFVEVGLTAFWEGRFYGGCPERFGGGGGVRLIWTGDCGKGDVGLGVVVRKKVISDF